MQLVRTVANVSHLPLDYRFDQLSEWSVVEHLDHGTLLFEFTSLLDFLRYLIVSLSISD